MKLLHWQQYFHGEWRLMIGHHATHLCFMDPRQWKFYWFYYRRSYHGVARDQTLHQIRLLWFDFTWSTFKKIL